jgi:hypothetical protein
MLFAVAFNREDLLMLTLLLAGRRQGSREKNMVNIKNMQVSQSVIKSTIKV